MKSRRHIARLTAVIGLVGTILAVPAVTPSVSTVSAAVPCLCAGGEFHPLTPARVFDSRLGDLSNHDVAPLGAKPLSPAVSTFDIDLLGLGGLPAATTDVLAVVVNITVTDPGASGYLAAYGKGFAPATPTSIINFAPGQTVPNVSIVRPGNDGDLTIGLFGQSGTANVIVDVFGWFSTSNYVPVAPAVNDGARLIPTTPSRVLDTRPGPLSVNRASQTPLAAKEVLTLQIRGVDGINPAVPDVVPDSLDITGVLLNVVGITTNPDSTATHLSVFPNPQPGGADPTTSNLNLARNVIKANLVFVPVGDDGSVRIFNNAGSTDVVADVVGYMRKGADPLTRAGRVVPLSSPYRTFDTREAPFGGVPLGPGQAEDWSFADFASSVTIGPDSVGNQLAVIGNLTSAELKRQYISVPAASFLTAYPAGAVRPLSSNLNTVEGPTPIPNMAILRYAASTNPTVTFYNLAGLDHYLFDASAVVLAD